MQGRGMCGSHWRQWARKNPDTRQRNTTMKAVEDSLPGTVIQLCEATGMCDEAIKNNLAWLKAEGRAHIGYFNPPQDKGHNWRAVWVEGEGNDARLTNAQKMQHRRKSNRESYARRQSAKKGAWGAVGIRALGARA